MTHDDEREELIMNANHASMIKIDRLFSTAFYVCMITPVVTQIKENLKANKTQAAVMDDLTTDELYEDL